MLVQDSAERRQVTILHSDIVDSTSFVTKLDPEVTMDLVRSYLDKCGLIIGSYDGQVANYAGDGFQAYFGFPIAQEGSAVDAVMAALQIQRMLATGQENSVLKLSSRIGISTGHVVVSAPDLERSGQPMSAFGTTPHLAARLEQAATPGIIFVDKLTRELCGERFSFREVGTVYAKGFSQDVEAWEVLNQQPTTRRFVTSKLGHFFGRKEELKTLGMLWRKCEAGHGQVVCITGDAGIGKSRLIHELQKTLPKDQVGIYQFQCSRQHTSTPLHPWIHSVQRYAKLQNIDIVTKRARLKDYLIRKIKLPEHIFEISAQLFGVADKKSQPGVEMSPQLLLQKLQDALVENLAGSAADFPILVVVEDVQWLDASTQRVVQGLADRLENEKIFLALTARTNMEPKLGSTPIERIELGRLDDKSVHDFMSELSLYSPEKLTVKSASAIRQKSDGIPLYIEELTKHYLVTKETEADNGGVQKRDELVPNVLQAPLLEQLNFAGDGKQICQLAAVIGSEFDAALMAKLLSEPQEDVLSILENLRTARILDHGKYGGESTFGFRHALLQDAVYASLLNATRTRMHRLVAENFSRSQKGAESGTADVIAYHFENAEDTPQAVQYWNLAGQRAMDTGATQEAADVFGRALNLVDRLENTRKNLQIVAGLHRAYGQSLNASGGVAADPIEQYRRAEKLSVELDDMDNAVEAMHCVAGLHFNAGELAASEEPALRMKLLGSKRNHTLATVAGCQALGMTRLMQGRFEEARDEFTLGLESAGNLISGIHCFPSMSLSYLAWTHYFLGEIQEAERCADRAIASSHMESTHALATALGNCGYVYQCLNLVDKVRTCCDELIRHAGKSGEMMYLKRGNILRDWIECVEEPSFETIQSIRENINLLLGAGEKIETTFLLGLLAEIEIRNNQFSDAETSLGMALQISEDSQEKFYLSVLYRLKAHLLSQTSDAQQCDEAMEYLQLAKDIATRQNAQALLMQFQMIP